MQERELPSATAAACRRVRLVTHLHILSVLVQLLQPRTLLPICLSSSHGVRAGRREAFTTRQRTQPCASIAACSFLRAFRIRFRSEHGGAGGGECLGEGGARRGAQSPAGRTKEADFAVLALVLVLQLHLLHLLHLQQQRFPGRLQRGPRPGVRHLGNDKPKCLAQDSCSAGAPAARGQPAAPFSGRARCCAAGSSGWPASEKGESGGHPRRRAVARPLLTFFGALTPFPRGVFAMARAEGRPCAAPRWQGPVKFASPPHRVASAPPCAPLTCA